MCTVTWIPQPDGGFVLTSNRDEAPRRAAVELTIQVIGPCRCCFPRDPVAGGTWIAADDSGRVACLLNGAFDKHVRRPPYRRSRGLMVLDSFYFARATDFFAQYAFDGMEPFTMIMAEQVELWEVRWDEQQLHCRQLDPQGQYIWSSATLYDAYWRAQRQQWFARWLTRHPQPTPSEAWDFHLYGGEVDAWNGFVMNRKDVVRTVSITQVVTNCSEALLMRHLDLLHDHIWQAKLNLQRQMPLNTFQLS